MQWKAFYSKDGKTEDNKEHWNSMNSWVDAKYKLQNEIYEKIMKKRGKIGKKKLKW